MAKKKKIRSFKIVKGEMVETTIPTGDEKEAKKVKLVAQREKLLRELRLKKQQSRPATVARKTPRKP